MNTDQAQAATNVIDAVQEGMAALGPFVPLIAAGVPGGPVGATAAMAIVNAGLTALSNSINSGADITDAQLAAIKAGDQAAAADDLAAQKAAWDAGDHSGTNPYDTSPSVSTATVASGAASTGGTKAVG